MSPMNIQHSEGETAIDPKEDYASLVALFLCQARNSDEIQLNLNLLNLGLRELSVTLIGNIRERISCDSEMPYETKELALNTIDEHLALRKLEFAAAA
jgi:hypothetical protein